jgi:hypothetical protein
MPLIMSVFLKSRLFYDIDMSLAHFDAVEESSFG